MTALWKVTQSGDCLCLLNKWWVKPWDSGSLLSALTKRLGIEMDFNNASLKNPVQQVKQLTAENIQYFAESLNGTVDESGILEFQISNHVHHAIPGDWLVLFDRGRDILVFTDKMFQRLYKSV